MTGISALREDLFAGAAVLVTGGTGGIGSAIATRFHQLGATVTVAGLPASPDRAAALGEVATLVEVDLAAEGAIEATIEAMDRLDVLVNAAGIIQRHEEYQPEVFSQVVAVNLTGAMRASVAARALLGPSGGCIVNIASMLSYVGGGLVPAYSASKGGVVQLTKSLAAGFADEGIRVNAVAPGWIRTDLTAALQRDAAADGRILERTPMGRWGAPEDVADVVAFLASGGARFMTGAIVPVDGGYLAT